MVKIKNLLKRQECGKKAYYNEGGLDSEKTYHYYLGVLFTSLIKDTNFLLLSNEEIESKYEENIPLSLFTNKIEYDEQKDIFITRVMNMKNHLSSHYKLLDTVFGDIDINGEVVILSNLRLLEDIHSGQKYLAVFKTKKMELTLRGRKPETLPAHNIELAAIQLLAKEKFKNESVIPMMITLKSRNAKSTDTNFEEKPTHNIISYEFTQQQLDTLQGQMNDLITMRIDKNVERNITSKCDTCQFLSMCQPKLMIEPKKKKKSDNKALPVRNVQFTKNQYELIFTKTGVIRANAGAGAGKTTVVAARYLNLLTSENLNSKEILLITYTRKGVEEMKKRILEFAPDFGLELKEKDIRVQTFHEFSEKFISRHKKMFGYKDDISIASIAQNMSLANQVIESVEGKVSFFRYNTPKLNIFTAKGALYQLLDWMTYIRDMKTRKQNYDYIIEKHKQPKVTDEDILVLEEYFAKFEELRKEKSLVQYDVLIDEMMKALQSGKVKPSQVPFKHIMVDEGQDTDDYQMEIIVQLTSILEDFRSLLFIGDDGQSIFRFRKTNVDNFIFLETIFDDVKNIHLNENFRSTDKIVALGNAINDLNEFKIDKTSIAVKKGKTIPSYKELNSLEEEYLSIVNNIKGDIAKGIPLTEIAVIARTNKELKMIQALLNDAKISSIIITPEKLIQNSSLQSFIALAKTLVSLPEERTNKEIYESFSFFTPEALNPLQIEVHVNQFKKRIEEQYDSVDEENKKLFVENYYEELFKKDISLEVLKEKVKKLSLDDLLTYLIDMGRYEDDISFSIDEEKYDGVILTTIHTSKGKEFTSVHHTLTGYSSKVESKDEENNLLFVAVTRAKESLKLYDVAQSKSYIRNVVDILNREGVLVKES